MSEYYAVIRSTDHLAHYGVKGMKWGVRKAIISGNQKMLDKHFRKAAKKLARLQDKALHSGKYATKAAAYGAAAAGVGTLAIGGTGLAAKGMRSTGNVISRAGSKLSSNLYAIGKAKKSSVLKKIGAHGGQAMIGIGNTISEAGNSFERWGKIKSKPKYSKTLKRVFDRNTGKYKYVTVHKYAGGAGISQAKTMTNDTKLRIGAGIASAALGAAAARNAYIAANGRKYLDKADTFRREMDNAFTGTKYEGQYIAPSKRRKKHNSRR